MKMKIKEQIGKVHMTKPMRKVLIIMGGLLLIIWCYHLISSLITKYQLEEDANAPISVSTTTVTYQEWEPSVTALGNLLAHKGINISSEADGLIEKIYFVSNQHVNEGEPLIQLTAAPDIAALKSLEAQAQLAELTYKRSKEQFAFNGISAETLEENEYTMRMQQADMQEQAAVVNQKTIRAPFSGQVGVSTLSVGQYIAAGDPIITLQDIKTLYVYFYVPEQYLPKLKIGQPISLYTDSYPDKVYPGKISAIDPVVDNETRNIKLQATIENPNTELLPGMYSNIEAMIGEPEKYLTIPQAAVSYNPYGNLVYVVSKGKEDKEQDDEHKSNNNNTKNHNNTKHKTNHKKEKETGLYVKQQFITLGETRGDQVVVTKGLKEGDVIVTSGQLKLRNHAHIVVNNEVMPSNDAKPNVANE